MNKNEVIGQCAVCDQPFTLNTINNHHGACLKLDNLDLENCTIREREMFEIGFKHGKRVTLTEMKRQMEEVLCEEK